MSVGYVLGKEGKTIKTIEFSIAPNDFTQSGDLYQCTITNANVTASSAVIVNISKETMSVAEEASMKGYVTTANGSFTIYAESAPSGSITGSYLVFGGA